MSAPTLIDLAARVENLKRASLLQKAALAEQTIADVLKYLEALEFRIKGLEFLKDELESIHEEEVTHGD